MDEFVVVEPFGFEGRNLMRGDRITDRKQMNAIAESHPHHVVRRLLTDAEMEAQAKAAAPATEG